MGMSTAASTQSFLSCSPIEPQSILTSKASGGPRIKRRSMIPIADLHTHPLLPQYYFRKDLGKRQKTSLSYPYFPFGTQIDLPRMKESGVTLMVACVYALNRLPHKDCF